MNPEEAGRAIQAYVRNKKRRSQSGAAGSPEDDALDAAMRRRVDALGLDDERLLDVAPGQVLARLKSLEAEAVSEDGRAAAAASRLAHNEGTPAAARGRPGGGRPNRGPPRQSGGGNRRGGR